MLRLTLPAVAVYERTVETGLLLNGHSDSQTDMDLSAKQFFF